jgi:hypothetical protein
MLSVIISILLFLLLTFFQFNAKSTVDRLKFRNFTFKKEQLIKMMCNNKLKQIDTFNLSFSIE